METARLVAQRRQETGKGVARRLRRAGKLPAVLYGHGETLALSIDDRVLWLIRHSEAGENTIIDLVIDGEQPETCNAILRDVQIDPVSQGQLHADLYRIVMDEPITVTVPLEFINEPEDRLRIAQAVVTPLLREVEVQCLPRDIPDTIVVDLEDLQIGDVLHAGDLRLPSAVTLMTDAEETVLTTSISAAAEMAAEEAEAEEAVAEAPEGESAEAEETSSSDQES
jgi:large subunit ribosomal protein L25